MTWEIVKRSLTVRIVLTLSKFTGIALVLTAIIWGSVGIATVAECIEIFTIGVLLIGFKTGAQAVLDYKKMGVDNE